MRNTILIGILINAVALIFYLYFEKTTNVVFHSLLILVFFVFSLKDDIREANTLNRELMENLQQKEYSREEVKGLINDFADEHDIPLTDYRTQYWIRKNFPNG